MLLGGDLYPSIFNGGAYIYPSMATLLYSIFGLVLISHKIKPTLLPLIALPQGCSLKDTDPKETLKSKGRTQNIKTYETIM